MFPVDNDSEAYSKSIFYRAATGTCDGVGGECVAQDVG